MIRHAHPKRIIEVGSGYSSCVTLDTNEIYFNNAIKCTFVDPFPDLLLSVLKQGDTARIEIIRRKLQDVEIDVFRSLSAGDILFIDGSHVSKVGSDVNYALFEILPSLNPGVYIHFHDVFYPFEYPLDWLYEGRAWNENYLLRAFLQYNAHFQIAFWTPYMFQFHRQAMIEKMPLGERNSGGSLWLRKLSD